MFVSIEKSFIKNFAFIILLNLELFTREFAFFLKIRPMFNVFYCFRVILNRHFTYFAYLRK